MNYSGGCHCGALTFRFETAKAPRDWSVRACQCSFCRAHAALSASDPDGSIAFAETRKGALHRYRFGQKTADFLVCRDCGVYIGATIETPRGPFGIVNVRALKVIPDDLPAAQPMHYEAESMEERTARREQRWSRVTA